MGYTPYLVAGLNSGISTYLKPWLRPDQALTDMEDCYVYRGQIQKRFGYDLYDTFPAHPGLYFAATGDGSTTTFTFTLPFATVANPIGKKSLTITHTVGGTVNTNGTD